MILDNSHILNHGRENTEKSRTTNPDGHRILKSGKDTCTRFTIHISVGGLVRLKGHRTWGSEEGVGGGVCGWESSASLRRKGEGGQLSKKMGSERERGKHMSGIIEEGKPKKRPVRKKTRE